MNARLSSVLVFLLILSFLGRAGAATWTATPSNAPGTTNQFRCIWAADANNAWSTAGTTSAPVLVKWNGSAWAVQSASATLGLYSVWGTSASNVWVGGRGGTLMRYNGSGWTNFTSGLEAGDTNGPYFIYGMWGNAANSIWAVANNGQFGKILKWNGSSWSTQFTHSDGNSAGLRAVWGTSASNVWAVGDSGKILHFDGSTWSSVSYSVSPAVNSTLFSIWGTDANNVWFGGGIIGSNVTLLKWDGTSITRFSTAGLPAAASVGSVRGIAGTSANNIYIVGDSGAFLSRWNGTTWATETVNGINSLNSIWCSPDGSSLWASGGGSSIFKGVAAPDVAAPTVTGVSPSSGPASGGATVTVTGTDFTGATAVSIGGTPATTFTVNNATNITATTPVHAAGTASVVVTTPAGSNEANTLYTYVDAPTVTGVSPSSGPTAGGTGLTITGTNFTGATAVSIGGTPATTFTVSNATTITATTPPHAAGPVSVTVTTAGGISASNSFFTYIAPAPEINVFKGAGTDPDNALADNSGSDDFGGVNAGSSGGAGTFTIQNTGTANLTGIAVTSNNSAEFTVNSAGLAATLAPNATAAFTVTFSPSARGARSGVISVASNDADENPFNFTVQGTGLNNAPTNITLSNATLAENNAAGTTVGTFTATDADAGDSHTFSLVSGAGSQDNGSFTITGNTLKLTPVADFETKSIYSLRVQADDSHGGVFAKAFEVTITDVNDAPTLAAVSDPAAIDEDATEQTVNLSGISAGAGETQTLTVTAQSGNPSLIPDPVVSYTSPAATGTLRFQPVANLSGQAAITVTVSDGQSANSTVARTFTVTVRPVNDPPSFTKGANQDILLPGSTGGGGLRSVTGWATGISDGDAEAAQNLTFNVSVTSGADLFATPPAVSSTGTLTYELSGKGGTAAVSISLTDDASIGGSPALTTAVQTFSISMNHAPVTVADSMGATQGVTASVNPKKFSLNDSDPDGDAISITAVQSAGGNASVSLTGGKILYTAPPGFTGADSFTYTLTDARGATASGTVNVTVAASTDPSQNYVIQATPEGIRLRFAASPGERYLIQYSPDLTGWQLLAGPLTADEHGVIEYLDTAGAPTRFYRTVAAPASPPP